MRPYREQVRNGIKLLDRVRPFWREIILKVGPDNIHMDDTYKCIIGRAFDQPYQKTLPQLFPGNEKELYIAAGRHGFNLRGAPGVWNTETWNQAFRELRDEWFRQLTEEDKNESIVSEAWVRKGSIERDQAPQPEETWVA